MKYSQKFFTTHNKKREKKKTAEKWEEKEGETERKSFHAEKLPENQSLLKS